MVDADSAPDCVQDCTLQGAGLCISRGFAMAAAAGGAFHFHAFILITFRRYLLIFTIFNAVISSCELMKILHVYFELQDLAQQAILIWL